MHSHFCCSFVCFCLVPFVALHVCGLGGWGVFWPRQLLCWMTGLAPTLQTYI